MPWSLRVAAFLTGVCALYVVGYLAMSFTSPPMWPLWMLPMAVAAGGAWHLLERLDARLGRRARDRAGHDADGHA